MFAAGQPYRELVEQLLGASEPYLHPGRNVSTWPLLKLTRATAHRDVLRNQFLAWVETQPLSTRNTLQADRRTIHSFLNVRSAPNTEDWSLTLGDVLHNLRSALDAVAWEVATFDGAKPRNPRLVCYPICLEEKQWESAVERWIGDIHPDLASRLCGVQPFNFDLNGVQHGLDILHRLDILDKHQSAIAVDIMQDVLELDGGFKLINSEAFEEPRLKIVEDAVFEDGSLVLITDAGGEIETEFNYEPRPYPRMITRVRDDVFDVGELVDRLLWEVRRHISLIFTDRDVPEEANPHHVSPRTEGNDLG